MRKVLVEESSLSGIATAIRSKNGTSNIYKPGQMPQAILDLPTDATLESLSVTENGTYTPPTGVDGYNPVTIDVQPNLQSKTVTENGTVMADAGYDGLSQVVVNVSGESRGPELIAPLSHQYSYDMPTGCTLNTSEPILTFTINGSSTSTRFVSINASGNEFKYFNNCKLFATGENIPDNIVIFAVFTQRRINNGNRSPEAPVNGREVTIPDYTSIISDSETMAITLRIPADVSFTNTKVRIYIYAV